MTTQLVPIDAITRNPKQPRESFPEDYIQQLAASIKRRGLIQPITLRPAGPGRYMIVAGECRYRAHRLLGRDTIRAEIVEINDSEMQFRAIVENLQRKDMNPLEEARAFKTLLDLDYTPERVMEELSLKSTALITHRLHLLDLIPEVQQLVISNNLSVTMAWAVSLVPPHRQLEMVRSISSGKLRTAEQARHAALAMRDAEAQIDVFAEEPRASPKDVVAVNRLENKIASIVAMVQLGFKDGECVAAQRVSPDRVKTMADQLALVRKHVLDMEHDLRRVATQTEIKLERRANENAIRAKSLRLADRRGTKTDRKPNVGGRTSRAASDSRREKTRAAFDR